jgi:hypothetical protein
MQACCLPTWHGSSTGAATTATGRGDGTHCWCAAVAAVGERHTCGHCNAAAGGRCHVQDDDVNVCGGIGVLQSSCPNGHHRDDRRPRGASYRWSSACRQNHLGADLDALEVGVPDALAKGAHTVVRQACHEHQLQNTTYTGVGCWARLKDAGLVLGHRTAGSTAGASAACDSSCKQLQVQQPFLRVLWRPALAPALAPESG